MRGARAELFLIVAEPCAIVARLESFDGFGAVFVCLRSIGLTE